GSRWLSVSSVAISMIVFCRGSRPVISRSIQHSRSLRGPPSGPAAELSEVASLVPESGGAEVGAGGAAAERDAPEGPDAAELPDLRGLTVPAPDRGTTVREPRG